jgi:Flp pilus assembly protein CpaB
VKKKSPPYAFIGAILLFFIALICLVQWKKSQDQKAADAVAAQKAADDKALADAQEKQISVAPTPTNMRNVFYATQPIEPGVRISPSFYEKKLTPNDILPDAINEQTDITGWVATRHIEKGDPLTPRNVGKSLAYLEERIAPGMRAISLPVFNATYNDTGGFVVDGDRVDLLYSVSTLESNLKVNTQTVLQNLSVLYVPGTPDQSKTDKIDGITPAPPPGDAIAVTFEVTPEEAQELIFLSEVKNGRFSMILRSRKDNSEIKIKPFNAEDYDLANLSKVQKTADKSIERVRALAAEIAAKEKQDQVNTNETNTPPSTP